MSQLRRKIIKKNLDPFSSKLYLLVYVDSVECFIIFQEKRGISHNLVILWTNDYDDQIVFLCTTEHKHTNLDNRMDRREQLLQLLRKKHLLKLDMQGLSFSPQ